MNINVSACDWEQLDELLPIVYHDDFKCGFAASPYETLAVASTDLGSDDLGSEWLIRRAALLRTIKSEQATDGSWGSDRHGDFTPDRIITTLAALVALSRHGPLERESRQLAIGYLRRSIPLTHGTFEAKKPIAFDALLVQLLVKAKESGHEVVQNAHLEALVVARAKTLRNKQALLVKQRGTIHSILDAMPPAELDWERIAELQEPNGSMGIYPSSTAALLTNLPRTSPAFERGASYLRASMGFDGSFPPFSPSSEFERWWALFALAQSPHKRRLRLPASLLHPIPREGISVAPAFSLPDVDTTAMKAVTLLTLGYPVDLGFLTGFYRNGVFECYEHEHRVSPSANIHALMAIVATMRLHPEQAGTEHHHMLSKSLEYLLDVLGSSDHFEDKWHLSDIYSTAHAVELFVDLLTLARFPGEPTTRRKVNEKLHELKEYLLNQGNADGGFGFRSTSTVEETGYAIRALCILSSRALDAIPTGSLMRASDYLQTHRASDDPPLWLGKSLYRSPLITASQKLSAQAWLQQLSPPSN